MFVVSWVNPDKTPREEDLRRLHARRHLRGAGRGASRPPASEDVNTIGYCIGGTLLSATLAYMAANGDTRINSATFFAAQADFSEAGDLQVFVDDAQLEALEQQMKEAGGVLEGGKMATTFNMLRANDLIWSFVVNNYLLGKEPLPFDLLYWNSDTTRMPEATHLFYLREFYKNNALSPRARWRSAACKLDLSQGEDPGLSAKREGRSHRALPLGLQDDAAVRRARSASSSPAAAISPASSTRRARRNTSTGPTTRRCGNTAKVEDWQDGATEHPGSWWPDWDAWLSQAVGQESARAQARRRQAQGAGRRARHLCEGQGAVNRARRIPSRTRHLYARSAATGEHP